jgi:hypothetical protein
MSDRETELDAPSNPETGRAEEHQLPPDFIFVLCAALAGGLPAGIFTTLISEPGRSGSPIYGLLLPWGILPFFLVLVAGWQGRNSPGLRRLAWFTSAASVLGLLVHGYASNRKEGWRRTGWFGAFERRRFRCMCRI